MARGQKETSLLSYYRWLWPYLRRRFPLLLLTFVLMLSVSLVQGLSIGLLSPVLRVLFGQEGMPSLFSRGMLRPVGEFLQTWLFSVPRDEALRRVAYLIVGMYFFRGVVIYAYQILVFSFEEGLVRDLRNALFEKVINMPLTHIRRMNTGELISRFYHDVSVLRETFAMGVLSALREALTGVAYLAVAVATSWRLTLFSLVVLPLMGGLINGVGRWIRKRSQKLHRRMGEMGQHVLESLEGMKIVKGFGYEDRETRTFKAKNQRLFLAGLKLVAVRELNSPISEFASALMAGVVLLVGGHFLARGELTADEFLVFLAAILSTLAPLKRVGQAYHRIQNGLSAYDRIREIFALPAERRPFTLQGRPFPGLSREIRVEGVHYRYPDGTWALRGVDLVIRKGETVALVGPSGAGKTTLVDLLAYFDRPTRGRIRVDGVDLATYDPLSYRQRIAVVPQEVYLFSGTLLENLLYARPDASEEELRHALEVADVLSVVQELPEGIHTRVGQGGIRLSGGQRQRIALARALLRDPDLLILDEPTASLDALSEDRIQEALHRAFQDRTVVIIAHRLATVLQADRIVVMDQGRVVAEGTHRELLERSPLYRELYRLQFQKPLEVRHASEPDPEAPL